LTSQGTSQPTSNFDDPNVKKITENKFIDLELQVLITLKFDFDFKYDTPFAFIMSFLHSNYEIITANIKETMGKE